MSKNISIIGTGIMGYPMAQNISKFYKLKAYNRTYIKSKNLKFHARHSAKKRRYEYLILNRIAKPSIDQDRVWFVKKKLDFKNLKKYLGK